MPYLGDFLGHLLSEITAARVQADLEAVRVAELYANHPLLKNMPVPRFRLPTLTLDVPVAVKEMEEAKEDAAPRGGVDLSRLRKRYAQVLDEHLEQAEIKLPAQERASLDQALDRTISNLDKVPYMSTSVMPIADEMVSTTIAALGRPKEAESAIEAGRLEKLAEVLKSTARLEFLNLRETPPRLSVLVTTAELREAGASQLLAQLHLSISEEAFEWSVVESQGTSNARLVPE